ncbi:PIG-L family deacetylase [bacterium]|nr:PIG-L family deacetylase [bacterium]
MFNHIKTVLVLAPHTDDAEFGCGGTIAKLLSNGIEVHCVAFSACKQSVLPQFPPDILITEVKAASKILGLKDENLWLYDYPVREFGFNRQSILDDMINLRTKIKPDLVFMPSVNDLHQDHQTIATEGLRAFKFSSILAYEVPWNNFSFNTSSFVMLDEQFVVTKIEALKKYKSQEHRSYANEEFVRSLARTRGVQIGAKFAESFDVIRWLIS